MTDPAKTVDQNILPVQAYFNIDGTFNTFIGQGQPFVISATESIGIVNSTVNATLYPTFTSATSGQVTGLAIASSTLTWNPGTGVFSAPTFFGVLNGTASIANNFANGTAGQIPYQTAANTTSFIPVGTTGQFLLSNGTSAPSWATVATSVAIADQTSDSATYYPLFYSATSGSTNTVQTSSTKLQYQPSTGKFTATSFNGSGALLTNIPNGALTNSSVTIGSTSIALGGTSLTLAGLTSVTATSFVGALTGNADTATTATNANNSAITDNTSSSATWYLTLVASTSGNQPLTSSSTKLSFQPSTSTLTASIFSGNLSGSATSAATLTTPRAIYGNNFDGSAALAQIIASTYGGTGNGFTKFSGATTAERTYTLPDANATILYSGGPLGTPSSGTVTNLTGTASININGTVGATTASTSQFTTGAFGGTQGTAQQLLIGGNSQTASTTEYGINNTQIVQSAVTSAYYGNRTLIGTQASAFTLTALSHFLAQTGTFGSGSTVTTQAGFHVGSGMTGATNNYGYYGNLANATGVFNLYMAGTAINYLAGSLGIGTASIGSVASSLVVKGITSVSASAPTIASATTIAPVNSIVFISGVTPIVTITPPSPISLGGGQITLIPTGIFTTTTAGNIALASTAIVSKALIMTYDATTTKWYPSY